MFMILKGLISNILNINFNHKRYKKHKFKNNSFIYKYFI